MNDMTKRQMIDKVSDLCGGSVTVIPALVGSGAQVRVVDPHGRKESAALLPGVAGMDDPYAATEGAECLLTLTEWNQFRRLDLHRMAKAMASPRMADLRNIYERDDVLAAGFVAYECLGRPQPVCATGSARDAAE